MSSCNFACKSIAKAVDLELTQYIMKAEFENAKIDFRYLLIDEVTNSEMVTSPPKKGVMDLFAVNRDDDLASLRRLGVMIHAEMDGPEPVGDSYVSTSKLIMGKSALIPDLRRRPCNPSESAA